MYLDRDDGPEIPLLGGDVTDGIVRVGDTVRRPLGPHSPLVHEVLAYLERVGFRGAPRLLGIDARGREVLSFIDGEVAQRPWPEWVADPDRIASVARLVRAYDDAIAPLGIPFSAVQASRVPGAPPKVGGPAELIGHLDVTPENVVFRDGLACALIDFDFVQSATRVQEICNVLLWWAPLMPTQDREQALAGVDPIARAALLVGAYGLGAVDRQDVVAVARNTANRAWYQMKDRADRLGGGWQRMWDAGVGDRILRRKAWLRDHGEALHDAITRS